jgi:D-threo-aldose 1-dehydrogenase
MPLPTVALGAGCIQTTPLGFGCAGLFRVPSATQRSRLLHTAYDAGIRHFDVAPMYGLGRAEHELGSFARARRAELTIATKFGIKPTLVARGLAYAQRPVRRMFEARPAMRDYARTPAGPSRHLYEQGGYHSSGARHSLERSLRALHTDYVDLFLLHDPSPGSVRSDEVFSFLEDARTAGLIRSWGIAGEPESTSEVARSFQQDVPIRQLRDDVFLRSLQCVPTGTAFITYGVMVRALACIVQHLRANDSRRLRWKETVGEDCGDPEIAASFLLRAAFRDNRSGVVLFSTVHPSRMRSATAALEMSHSPDESTLDAFLQMVDVDLCGLQAPEREGS